MTVSDERELGTKLRQLGETAVVPLDATQRIAGSLTSTRRRRRTIVGGVAALAVIAGSAVIAQTQRGDDGGTPPADQNGAGSWAPIATSPLSGRTGALAVWTGEEMLVVGGATGPPCPPNADCSGPTPDQLSLEGAAYNPATDSWREIAAAPGTLQGGHAVWMGDYLLVVTPKATLGYALDDDFWWVINGFSPIDDTGYLEGGERTSDGVVFWQGEEHRGSKDWILDPARSDWRALPPDPFPRTFDRSYTWSGDELIFTGQLVSGVGAPETAHFQVASYDLTSSEWTTLPESPVGFANPQWYAFDHQVVNPSQLILNGGSDDETWPAGAYDPATGQWREVPQADVGYDDLDASCDLPAIGPAGRWLAASGSILVSLTPADTMLTPGCPGLPAPDVAVWTGQEFVIWGGPSPDYEDNTSNGFSWTPPAPGT